MSAWYLRKPSREIYGPVDLAELIKWVHVGRVGPDDDLSEDQESWQPAPLLKPLEMDWSIVQNEDEIFGPFNIAALKHLLTDGELGESTTVVNLHDGVRRQLGDVVKGERFPPVKATPVAAVPDPAIAIRANELEPSQKELSRLREELSELKSSMSSVDALKADLMAKSSTLESRDEEVERMRENNVLQMKELQKNQEKVVQLLDEVRSLESKADDAVASGKAIEQLQVELKKSRESQDSISAKLAGATAELSRVEKASAEAADAHEAAVSTLRKEKDRSETNLAKLTREYESMKVSLLDSSVESERLSLKIAKIQAASEAASKSAEAASSERVDVLEREKSELLSGNSKLQNQLKEAKGALASANEDLDEARAAIPKVNPEAVAALEKSNKEIERLEEDLREERARTASQVSALKNKVRELEAATIEKEEPPSLDEHEPEPTTDLAASVIRSAMRRMNSSTSTAAGRAACAQAIESAKREISKKPSVPDPVNVSTAASNAIRNAELQAMKKRAANRSRQSRLAATEYKKSRARNAARLQTNGPPVAGSPIPSRPKR